MPDATIARFTGPWAGFSNFEGPAVELDGESYDCVEKAFQAAKTFDPGARRAVRSASTPGQAKRLGRKVALRPDWEQAKLSIMEHLLRQKFQHAALQDLLLRSGGALIVEGNDWHDTFWGVCTGCLRGCQGAGANQLGRLLMALRDELCSTGSIATSPRPGV